MTLPELLLLQFAFAAALTGGTAAIGVRFTALVFPDWRARQLPPVAAAFSFLAGLLLELLLILGIGSSLLGSGLVIRSDPRLPSFVFDAVSAIVLMPWVIAPRRTLSELRALFPRLDFSFGLFSLLVLFFGISLFDTAGSITTPWPNNYGDLAFHLGIISSFIWGGNFIPQYPIFSGEPLSYPFLADLWTAQVWQPFARFETLDLVFVCQWVVLWSVIYRVLAECGSKLSAWAALFGGGAYPYLYQLASGAMDGSGRLLAHDLIDKGYPWVPLITTIWIPQRPMLLGAAILITAAAATIHADSNDGAEESLPALQRSAPLFLLSLGLIAHGHAALTGWLFCGGLILIRGARAAIGLKTSRPLVSSVTACAAGALPLLISVPFIWRKHSIVSLSAGWMPWDTGLTGIAGIVSGAAAMWAANALPVGLLFFWLVFRSRHRTELLLLALLFLLFNCIQIAVWNWDQIKLFAALYLVLLTAASFSASRLGAIGKIILGVVILPGVVESIRSLDPYKDLTVYSKESIKVAAEIRRLTRPGDIIAGMPDHNSPITLTGRVMFSGYSGTLNSHGIDYEERAAQGSGPSTLIPALTKEAARQGAAAYILLDPRSREITAAALGDRAEPTRSAQLLRIYPLRLIKQK